MRRPALALAALAALACSSSRPAPTHPPPATEPPPASDAGATTAATPRPRVEPPPPGPRRDVHLPPVRRSRLPNGLEVNAVAFRALLPVVHLSLVVRAGSSTDPPALPGLATLTGDMLKEGTRGRTSLQVAETVDFLGGQLAIETSTDETAVSISVLRENLEAALELLADLAAAPTFPQTELEKLRRRALDQLELRRQSPSWQARRAFYPAVYGDAHPYGRYDTTPDVLRRVSRADLAGFHRARYVAGNMFFVAVGDVDAATLDPLVRRTLGRVPRGTAPALRFPELPAAPARRIVLVDRPGSQQSVVWLGNAALARNDPQYIPLAVANHVLGGGPSSRLFMDLRELRSLSYGAYSRLGQSVAPGAWFASAQTRTAATGDTLHGLLQHVGCATTDPPPAPELDQTRSYLVDSFPLSIETPSDVAGLVSKLRLFDLPDNYWDTYRERVGQVDAAQAQSAAQRYIHPDRLVIVVVGAAEGDVEVGPLCAALGAPDRGGATVPARIARCAQASRAADGGAARPTQPLQTVLQSFGPVRVVDLEGRLVRELPATPPAQPPVPATCVEITAPALQHSAGGE